MSSASYVLEHSKTGASAGAHNNYRIFHRVDQLNLTGNSLPIYEPPTNTTSDTLWGHVAHNQSGKKCVSICSTCKRKSIHHYYNNAFFWSCEPNYVPHLCGAEFVKSYKFQHPFDFSWQGTPGLSVRTEKKPLITDTPKQFSKLSSMNAIYYYSKSKSNLRFIQGLMVLRWVNSFCSNGVWPQMSRQPLGSNWQWRHAAE